MNEKEYTGCHLGINWKIRISDQILFCYILLDHIDRDICVELKLSRSFIINNCYHLDLIHSIYDEIDSKQNLFKTIERLQEFYQLDSKKFIEAEKQFLELLK